MRVKFEAQLERLNVELITMGALCEEVISGAAKALLDGDSGLRETVLAAERDINQKERDIESLCMKLLLQQQPVARDLRTISSALKMISDMERIGDQAADIAEITRDIADNSIKDLVPIRGHGPGHHQDGYRQRGLLCPQGPGSGGGSDLLRRRGGRSVSPGP